MTISATSNVGREPATRSRRCHWLSRKSRLLSVTEKRHQPRFPCRHFRRLIHPAPSKRQSASSTMSCVPPIRSCRTSTTTCRPRFSNYSIRSATVRVIRPNRLRVTPPRRRPLGAEEGRHRARTRGLLILDVFLPHLVRYVAAATNPVPPAHKCCPQYRFFSTVNSESNLCELFPFRN